MNYEINAKIVAVLPTQSGQGKNGEWVKNQFVVEWQDNGYTQKLCLEVQGADKFDKMKNAIRVGNEVLCKFNVSSREWNGRWFTSCTCFYCATVGCANTSNSGSSNGGGQQQQHQQQTPAPAEDSLPF